MSEFTIVNQENLKSITEELTNKKGHILIAEPGHGSSQNNIIDARLSFYNRPLIDKDCLSVKRGHKKINGEN